jgi:hypothetical protein
MIGLLKSFDLTNICQKQVNPPMGISRFGYHAIEHTSILVEEKQDDNATKVINNIVK